ncbi:hypothetical protein [Dokdonella sp.]|uniref:hypothetical protein n=1 Tax=Dokdonella sp. TaxID=2291710 RepID=UPI003783826C
MTRLKTLAPGLAEKLASASAEEVRTIVLEACRSAVRESGLHDDEVSGALDLLRRHKGPAQGLAERIAALVERWDERYLALQEESDRGTASPGEYLVVFSQARAASAVAFAISDDSLESSMEALYEAAMATESPERTALGWEDLLK